MSNAPAVPGPEAAPALRAAATDPGDVRRHRGRAAAGEGEGRPPRSARRYRSPPTAKPVPTRPAIPRVRVRSRPRCRLRQRVTAVSFVLLVLLPLAASVWYLFARAADQYHSTAAFSVRSEEIGSAAAACSGR